MEASRYGSTRTAPVRRLATETKHAFKTTEFWVYLAAVIAVLFAGTVDDAEGAVTFSAEKVWLYITLLTIGYLVSRGLSKSGSRDPYWDQPNDRDPGSLGERVKAAAQTLADGESRQGEDEHVGRDRI